MFWGEAVCHSVQILNRVPTKGVKNKTPYEALHGKKPTLDHFRVLGCVAHAKRPANKLSKLSDRSIALVYLGNEPGSKAFRLYSPSEKRKYVARDVVFDEATKWKWAGNQDETHVFGQDWVRFPNEIPYVEDGENHVQAQDAKPQDGYGSPSLHYDSLNSTPPQTPISQDNYASNTPTTQGSNTTSMSSDPRPNRSTYDDTPVRGFRKLSDVINRCTQLEDEDEELMFAGEEPTTYLEATNDSVWREPMKKEIDSII